MLTSRFSWALVLAGYVTCLVLQIPLHLFAEVPPPYDVLQVAARSDLAVAGASVQRTVGMTVMVVTAVLLVRRLRAATRSQRRVLAPLYAYSIAAILLVPLSASYISPALSRSPVTTNVVQVIGLALNPIAFGYAAHVGGVAQRACRWGCTAGPSTSTSSASTPRAGGHRPGGGGRHHRREDGRRRGDRDQPGGSRAARGGRRHVRDLPRRRHPAARGSRAAPAPAARGGGRRLDLSAALCPAMAAHLLAGPVESEHRRVVSPAPTRAGRRRPPTDSRR